MMPAARLVCERPSSNFPYFRTPLANFLLSRLNSVEYGNCKRTTLLPSAKCTRPLFQGRTGCGGRPSGWHDIVTCQRLVGLVTLIFDIFYLETLKLVRESHLRWGTFLSNLGTLGLGFGFWNYSLCTRQTDGQKQRLMFPSLRAGRNKNIGKLRSIDVESLVKRMNFQQVSEICRV